jgi:hypothetical protein
MVNKTKITTSKALPIYRNGLANGRAHIHEPFELKPILLVTRRRVNITTVMKQENVMPSV